jgi:nucleoside 2-deoxyribosyltransferase
MGQVYLAGGWFTPQQESALNEARSTLSIAGLLFYDPQHDLLCPPDASDDFAKYVLAENCKQIKAASFVYASLVGKDLGTSWEVGYAVGCNVPVVYHSSPAAVEDSARLATVDFASLYNDYVLQCAHGDDLLIANTAGKDVVNVALAGYAAASGCKVIYLCEGLPPGAQFNLMLAKSGIAVATSADEADAYAKAFQSDCSWRKPYAGVIE